MPASITQQRVAQRGRWVQREEENIALSQSVSLLLTLLLASALSASAQESRPRPPGEIEFLRATALMRGEFDGKPVEKDPERALHYLQESAAKGYRNAPFALCIYLRTEKMGLFFVKAHEWCSVAAIIPGKTQAKSQSLLNELDQLLARAGNGALENAKEIAEATIKSFCSLNRQFQTEHVCPEDPSP